MLTIEISLEAQLRLSRVSPFIRHVSNEAGRERTSISAAGLNQPSTLGNSAPGQQRSDTAQFCSVKPPR